MPRKKDFSIDAIEARHIAISVLVVSVAFAWGAKNFLAEFALVALAVGTGFVLHELAHKYVAIGYGAKAAYRAWPFGLLLALGLAFATGGGFVFAAPGAVIIFGRRITLEQNGKISLAGPIANFAIACLFVSLAVLFPALSQPALFAARVNAFLGLFNLIPVFPLDGSKAFAWSKPAWLGACALLGGMLAFLILAFS